MNIKTITTVDGVNVVDFGSAASRFYWIENLGSTVVYVSGNENIVPDGDDEGFQAGYTEGYNDGREAQKKICDEEKAILIEEIDRQDKEIEELKDKQGYTFPEGTSYEDIYQFVGDDTVTDKTIGYSMRTDITPIEGDRQNANNTKVRIVDSSGNIVATIAGWDYCPDGKVYSIQISTNGDYIVRTSFLTYSGNSRYLVGFGASGNQINVQSN